MSGSAFAAPPRSEQPSPRITTWPCSSSSSLLDVELPREGNVLRSSAPRRRARVTADRLAGVSAASLQVAAAIAVAFVAACSGEPHPPAAARPGPAQADPWRIVASPSTDPTAPAVREDPAAPGEARPPPPAPTSPSPGSSTAAAPAPDPCAAYLERTITCTGPLRHMDQCSAEATAERRVAAIRARMRRCYSEALERDPGLAPKGELALTEEVDANGCVLRATPLRADPSYPPALVACVAHAAGLEAVPKGVAVTRRTRVVGDARP